MLAEVTTRKLRALVTAEAVDALTGGNDGPFVEQREGVYRTGLVLHEYYLFRLGLLINELGGVLETAQRWRREGAEGVDGNVPERAQNAVVGLLRMRLPGAIVSCRATGSNRADFLRVLLQRPRCYLG